MEAHKIKVPKTAHYYTIGKPSKKIEKFWIVTHGYGQMAKNFIYKFEDFDDGKTFVVAPDGFSRFYLDGYSGEVGSSWMTREDRLVEIADYSNFLQTIYDLFVPRLSNDVRIILFGFSQGCATHCRWIMRKFPKFHNLVLWSGLMPEDLDYRPYSDYFNSKTIHFVYGTKDPFLTEERKKEYRELIDNQKVKLNTKTFDGKHEVDREVLGEVKRML